jgi:ribonuclease J
MTKLSDLKDGFYFIPLGGSEQFGVNLNVYIYDGRMIAIDCGIGFADERFPGIDILLPDPAFLENNKSALEGMIITHAHEDHVGAVSYLWSRLKCPIYAAPFTAKVLENKFDETDVKNPPIKIIEPGGKITLGPFDLTFMPVAHSIPDSCAVLIEAGKTRVLHSGDWNLDPAPVVGYKTEKDVFQKAGKKGVDVYIGDSTNAGVPGRAGSESEVEDGLYEEFMKCNGRILVTTFSSNIGRLMTIARAAQKAGRDVGVIGRSMHKMIGAATALGYMKDIPDFVSDEDLGFLPDDKMVLICTGSQGESRAALARIARGDHRHMKIKRGDSVIFSARTIPGNEIHINAVKNNLTAAGVKVVTPSSSKHTIHVSGHPCQDEILELWSWVKPKAVIPVHGERMQLEAHAKLAKSAQVPNVVVPNNGSVIRLDGGVDVIDHIETGILAVDQKRIITSDHRSIAQRRKLQYTGAAFVTVVLDGKGKVTQDPMVETIGLIDADDESELQIEDKLYYEVLDILRDINKADLRDDHFVTEELRIGVRRFCDHVFGMKPNTIVHVVRV